MSVASTSPARTGLALVKGAVLAGVAGLMVDVEVSVAPGLPSVGVVGLPDTSVSEAKHRVRCALESGGFTWPMDRITVSLTPADVRKSGSTLDLAIAVGVLAASGQAPTDRLGETLLLGELALDGRILPVTGALALALAAQRAGFRRVIAAPEAASQAAVVPGLVVHEASSLVQVVSVLAACDPPMMQRVELASQPQQPGLDIADVRGQHEAVFALEVAAAGRHHLAITGPPGVGKSMLAARLPGLLPDLSETEWLEVASIRSVIGSFPHDRRPPCAEPHHSASTAALLGAVRGSRVLPGAATMAHRGVLLLDEAPEFARPSLEGLRQPLEMGHVSLHRAGWNGVLPARFQLVVTANPCPCGQRVGAADRCTCSSLQVRRYAARLSGPVMDRIDVRLTVTKPTASSLTMPSGEDSATIRGRVVEARLRAQHRFREQSWAYNSEIPVSALRRTWGPDDGGERLLARLEQDSMGLRGPDRILRLAWTIADLAGKVRPGEDEIAMGAALRAA